MYNKNTMYLENFETYYGISRQEIWLMAETEENQTPVCRNLYMLEGIEYYHILEIVI